MPNVTDCVNTAVASLKDARDIYVDEYVGVSRRERSRDQHFLGALDEVIEMAAGLLSIVDSPLEVYEYAC